MGGDASRDSGGSQCEWGCAALLHQVVIEDDEEEEQQQQQEAACPCFFPGCRKDLSRDNTALGCDGCFEEVEDEADVRWACRTHFREALRGSRSAEELAVFCPNHQPQHQVGRISECGLHHEA